MRADLEAIARWVTPGSRVLDLGCGDGSLLRYLWQSNQAPGYGVEIDDASVLACVENDVNVLQVDLESGLSLFADQSFEYVILSQTLQAVRHTEGILREMARIGVRGPHAGGMFDAAKEPRTAAEKGVARHRREGAHERVGLEVLRGAQRLGERPAGLREVRHDLARVARRPVGRFGVPLGKTADLTTGRSESPRGEN